ncbi:conserved hypothetical protein [Trichinella spiralis]|uniref:hypothetical protein n=1 Tax=Trichinella spiralis TaxID=6334 RepID=UPI0001EFE9E1|nr:conserved hypothetical protein [Trichinella spiralis]
MIGHKSTISSIRCDSNGFHVPRTLFSGVLINFPWAVLFGKGLVEYEKKKRDLPPAPGCSLKQPDSIRSPRHHAQNIVRYGSCTRSEAPIKGAYELISAHATTPLTPHC